MTAELINDLRAQLDADEAVARGTYTPGPWGHKKTSGLDEIESAVGHIVCTAYTRDAAHIALHEPEHVLRDIAAKRALLNNLEDAEQRMDTAMKDNDQPGYQRAKAERDVLRRYARLLAAAYEDRGTDREEQT